MNVFTCTQYSGKQLKTKPFLLLCRAVQMNLYAHLTNMNRNVMSIKHSGILWDEVPACITAPGSRDHPISATPF